MTSIAGFAGLPDRRYRRKTLSSASRTSPAGSAAGSGSRQRQAILMLTSPASRR
jgi:hypothetical protein